MLFFLFFFFFKLYIAKSVTLFTLLQDSKKHLNGLSALGMSSMVAEITEDTEKDAQNQNGDVAEQPDKGLKESLLLISKVFLYWQS